MKLLHDELNKLNAIKNKQALVIYKLLKVYFTYIIMKKLTGMSHNIYLK